MSVAAPLLKWHSSARTHPGKVRRLNEDDYLDRPELGVWAVADGMGGHHGGEIASRAVVEALAEAPSGSALEACFMDCEANLRAVNRQLFRQSRQQPRKLSGATVVALLCSGERAALLWAGDSRAYRLAAGGDEPLVQLTADHSRVAEMVRRGQLTESEAETHPDANLITRAVGVREELELDVKYVTVAAGDTFLLCSDGLCRYLSRDTMAAALNQATVSAAAEALEAAALATPARDNITIVVIRSAADSDTRTRINRANRQRGRGFAAEDDPTVLSDGLDEPKEPLR